MPLLNFIVGSTVMLSMPFGVYLLGMALKHSTITRWGIYGLKVMAWFVTLLFIGGCFVQLLFHAYGVETWTTYNQYQRESIANTVWLVFAPLYILGSIAYLRNRKTA